MQRLPAALTWRTVSSASSCSLRYTITTFAPSLANAIATARPMPLSPPVMSAVFPSSLPLPTYSFASAAGGGRIGCSRPGCCVWCCGGLMADFSCCLDMASSFERAAIPERGRIHAIDPRGACGTAQRYRPRGRNSTDRAKVRVSLRLAWNQHESLAACPTRRHPPWTRRDRCCRPPAGRGRDPRPRPRRRVASSRAPGRTWWRRRHPRRRVP